MLDKILIPIHREGWFFVAIAFAVTFILALIDETLGWFGAAITAWVAYFFRDPERVTPNRPGLVISPADGVVQTIKTVTPPEELNLKGNDWTRISIFLNIFDVHVNRIPVEGIIERSHYHAGKFFNASLDKASIHNERQALTIKTPSGLSFGCVQIAGLIARRIRCDVHEGQSVSAGERFGLIRFGSRADIYLPKSIKPLVMEGQRMIAGETVLAEYSAKKKS